MALFRVATIALLLVLLPAFAPAQRLVHGKAAMHVDAPDRTAWRAAAYPRDSEGTLALTPLAATPKALQAPDDKRMRVGIARDASQDAQGAAMSTAAWIDNGDGMRVARLRVTSPGAEALRVGLALRGVPRAAELRVAAGDDVPRIAPVSGSALEASMRAQGVFWTPLTEGETQVIELAIPATSAPPGIAVTSVSHLLASPAHLFKSTGPGASQGCEENVVCVAGRNPALAQAANAVAKLLYTENGVSYLCTGTLVNDGDPTSEVPHMLTAAHCIDSDAAAATLNTFWFFQSSSCNGKDAAGYKQLAGGATLLYASSATDVALIRLRDRAPDGAWFAGWDASPLADGADIVTLHHPAGDVKKVSLGQAAGTAGSGDASYTAVAWLTGSTEGGSSGSGLFTFDGTEYVLRGALRGGSASCSNSGVASDPSNRDFFSRLDLEPSALAQWLTAAPAPMDDYTGLWFNPSEAGSGVSIVQDAANHVFAAWFTYDAQGNPTWVVMPQASWTSAVTIEGTLYRARGSAWDAPYDASALSVAPAGTLRVQFNADGTANATFTLDGHSVVKTLQRQPI